MEPTTILDMRIRALQSPFFRLRRLHVSSKFFEALCHEVKDSYQREYGGHPIDKKAWDDGFLNILYRGVVICTFKAVKREEDPS